jgi:hypothetical protein
MQFLGSSNQGRMRLAGVPACMGEKINAYKILVGKSEGKSSFQKPKRTVERSIKVNLKNYDGKT